MIDNIKILMESIFQAKPKRQDLATHLNMKEMFAQSKFAQGQRSKQADDFINKLKTRISKQVTPLKFKLNKQPAMFPTKVF
jgi:hypothetical protein